MPNNYFKFKQFTVHQDRCAMKVSTDACILGAYTAKTAFKHPPKHILDIGAGTGILSLMLAQKLPNAQIDSVELEAEAYQQCTENIANSPWEENISVYCQDIQSFAKNTTRRYELIITNPPFYPKHLLSPQYGRRQARHTNSLEFPDLLEVIQKLLTSTGSAFILLPSQQSKELSELAKSYDLHLLSTLCFRSKEHKPITRIISQYQLGTPNIPPQSKTFNVHDFEGNYSDFFRELMKAYYLTV